MLLLPVALPAVAAATIFEVDDRVPAQKGEFAAVGTLSGGANVVYGSGFLIDPCTVLSARHVGGSVARIVGSELTFRSGTHDSTGQIIAAGAFQSSSSESRVIAQDWMVVRLRKCLGYQLGYFRLSSAEVIFAKREFKIADVGFPRDHPLTGGPTIDPHCRLLWIARGEIAHDCATLPGNSGGPLLVRSGKDWVAIGINAAGKDNPLPQPFQANTPNIAVDIGHLLSNICSQIGTDLKNPLCANH